MKLLLGATIALLLGALAVSWQGMKTGVRNTPSAEIARLESQVRELRAEQDKLQLEKQRQQLIGTAPDPDAELNAMKLQLAQQKQALDQIGQQERDLRDKKVADEEEVLGDQRALESKDSELRRARMISQSLLIGRVKEYVEDPALGGFVTFEVQTGAIMAIRRKTGILGQLKVSDVSAEGAIANPLPGFGPVKPVAGDELILPPQY